jgi:hypothetical protein
VLAPPTHPGNVDELQAGIESTYANFLPNLASAFYVVPNFGVDRDIITTQSNLKNAEAKLGKKLA